MKLSATIWICLIMLAVSGCGRSPAPAPPVAQAYADQFGPVESSRSTPCPKVQGIWQLSNFSAGSLLKADGETIEHFRWGGAMLFGVSFGTNAYIAVDPLPMETILYIADKFPADTRRYPSNYTTKSDKEMPCVGHGWRQVVVTDHSLNERSANVLGMLPELPKKITQTDYIAKNAANELLLAIRIDFQGTDTDKKPVNGGYWHFMKMPRLFANPQEKGFKVP